MRKVSAQDYESLDFRNEYHEVECEPYDPEYLSDEPYQVPDLSSYEKRFIHKISILENKLRRAKIRYEWDEYMECFRIKKYVGESEYPTYRYVGVNMDENDYFFGTKDEDLVYGGRVTVAVTAAKNWLDSKLIKK